MKSILKNILVGILGSQVRRLREGNDFKIIGVVGSIGKTSTKLAIAKVLQSEKRVQFQEGNYNDSVSVPLVFFGEKMPSLWNVFDWIKIIIKNEIKVWSDYVYDFVVLELGTDKPGDINQFRKYLHLDILVVTATTFEHMQFFKDLDAVVDEEWSASFFSDAVFANRDLCKSIPQGIDHKKVMFYGKDFGSVYKIENVVKTDNVFHFSLSFEGNKILDLSYQGLSEVELYSICAASLIAHQFRIPTEKIKKSVKEIKSFAGRMQRLRGIKNSIIIDDSYNASPEAMKIALDTLYAFAAPQRIAILGMMNELGAISEEEHRKLGKYCDPKLLDLVVTVGLEANKFLAEEARKKGCNVYEAKNALDAGAFVKEKIKDGAIILVKGSQNGVFTEESLKPLLKDKSDFSRLVRQEETWMKKKRLTPYSH